MVKFKDTSIIIPAYNEEETISELIKSIKNISEDFEIIICSDGSIDRTAEYAKKEGVKVIEHPYNIGNGAAIKNGVSIASREYIILMDADMQHQPKDILKLLEFLPQYDMVVGSRTSKSKTSITRDIGNYILNKVAEHISHYKIEDLTSGFRAVKKEKFIQFLHLFPLRYSYPTTITLAFFCSGYFVKYVRLDSIVKRVSGRSQIKPVSDGNKMIQIIVRIIMIFQPRKIFDPIALLFFIFGIGFSVFQFFFTGGIRSGGVIFLVSSILIFLNGMLVEHISQLRRDINKNK